MGIKKVKPTSPGRRTQTYSTFDEITRTTPEKSLLRTIKKTGGRNVHGRITCRHRGGGHKRHYRIIDFKRDKTGIPAKVASIEYDPNRSARIALLHYADGEKRYILAPINLKVGDTVLSGPGADIKPGNTLPLKNIPLGTHIHNIELRVGKGGQIVRSAGTFAQLMAKENEMAQLQQQQDECTRRAEAALKAGDDDAARAALQQKVKLAERTTQMTPGVEKGRKTFEMLRENLTALQQQLKDAKLKLQDLRTRQRLAQAQKAFDDHLQTATGTSPDGVAFDRLEDEVAQSEAEVEIRAQMQGTSLTDVELAQKSRELQVEAELQALKDKLDT